MAGLKTSARSSQDTKHTEVGIERGLAKVCGEKTEWRTWPGGGKFHLLKRIPVGGRWGLYRVVDPAINAGLKRVAQKKKVAQPRTKS